MVPQRPLGQQAKVRGGHQPAQKASYKNPPQELVQAQYHAIATQADDVTAEEARQLAREGIAQMYPRADLDELLPPLEPSPE
eukprot:8361423-Karenia_brevis.AAC.1